jgi:peptide/nickel transport system substrate-binding protein
VKLAPKVYYLAAGIWPKITEAIQGYQRKIGIDWKLQPWDPTIAPSKMAEQDYEIWSLPVPYLTAGDLMNIYFDSKNVPAPNRMNWKDAETDAWLAAGRTALTDADRARAYGQVQEKVMAEHLWMPVLNVPMYMMTTKRLKGARPHMLYQNTFYKGLDLSF